MIFAIALMTFIWDIKDKRTKKAFLEIVYFFTGFILALLPALIYFKVNDSLSYFWEAYFYNNIFLYYSMNAPKRKDERSEFFAKSFAYTAILSENEKDRLPCIEICLIDTLSVDEGEYILEGHNDKQHHEQHSMQHTAARFGNIH